MITFQTAIGAFNQYLRHRGHASQRRMAVYFAERWNVNHKVVIMFLVMATNAGYVIRNMDGRYMSADMNAPALRHRISGRVVGQ